MVKSGCKNAKLFFAEPLISSKTRIEILKILALNPESAFHINQLGRQTGFSPRGVEKELKNLIGTGTK
jgi:hypothetical protein